MTPRERDLLEGMGNCFAACHASFEETIRMVGGHRGLTPDQVRENLKRLREAYADTDEYRLLRERVPADFPY